MPWAGRRTATRDIQVTRVEKNAGLARRVRRARHGRHAGRLRRAEVSLVVEDDGTIVSTQDVVLPDDGRHRP